MSVALSKLKLRAEAHRRVRTFFFSKECLEVDCPALDAFATIDAYIDPIETSCGYLHTSPEYGMKKLLAESPCDIYQISHVFRAHESGSRHRPEFTMLEWYRMGWSLEALIEESKEVIALFKPGLSYQKMTWKDAFQKHLSIDPFHVDSSVLLRLLEPLNLSKDSAQSSKEDLLDMAFSTFIEPKLGSACIIDQFPASSAALAKADIDAEGNAVCRRFEIYIDGYEVANGYDELVGPGASTQMRARFENALQIRAKAQKAPLLIDEQLLEALDRIPPCVGVAMGFDRLLMLSINADKISSVTL